MIYSIIQWILCFVQNMFMIKCKNAKTLLAFSNNKDVIGNISHDIKCKM